MTFRERSTGRSGRGAVLNLSIGWFISGPETVAEKDVMFVLLTVLITGAVVSAELPWRT